MENILSSKMMDNWEEHFYQDGESALFNSVTEMEACSEWIPGICAKDIRLQAIDGRPMFLEEEVRQYHLPSADLTEETALLGTDLLIYTGVPYRTGSLQTYELVRNTAMDGIGAVAKLYGSALSRMDKSLYVETMNNAFSVAKGTALGLMRYGKLSGLQSGADGGYMIMPISKLLDIAADCLTRRFRTAEMVNGYNTHGFTSALWKLPDAQNRLVEMYQDALQRSGNASQYAVNYMPAVDFHSSDTKASCAVLDPVFILPSGVPVHFIEGVRIKHLKRGQARDTDGLKLFAEAADNIYAKFEATAEAIQNLSAVKIYHPANCVIKLCRAFHIPPKYGQAAYDEAERIALGNSYITAHDLYIAMNEILAEAERCDASANVINNLEESLMRIVRCDFSEYDIGGVVAWKDENNT